MNVKRQILVSSGTFFLLLSLTLSGLAQQEQDSLATQIRQAEALYSTGQLEKSLRLLRALEKQHSDNIPILTLMGIIESKREKWGNSKDWMDKVLKLDPESLVGHYYYGIGYRETGKFKALIFRRHDFSEAEKHFKYVIERDPRFQDVYFQFAVLERLRGNLERAVELGERQLELRDDLPKTAAGLFDLYDAFLFYKKEKDVKKFLAKKAGPRSDFFNAELHRQHNRLPEAEAIYLRLVQNPDPQVPRSALNLALARLKMQQNQVSESERYYMQALDSLNSQVDAQILFENIKYILTDAEYNAYQMIEGHAEKRAFFQDLWRRRNPIPSANENPRIAEHVRRLIYVEKHYQFDGVRSWVNSPDKLGFLDFPLVFALNTKFNDKGLVYLRHGDPDDTAYELGEGLQPNESWLYYPSSGVQQKLMFHFLVDLDATGNNWRLTALVPRAMLESRLNFDPIFQKMYMAAPLEYNNYELELGEISRRNVQVGLMTDRHQWSKALQALSVPFYVSTFRGDNNLTRFEVCYGLDSQEIFEKIKSVSADHSVYIGLSVYDQNWQPVKQMDRQVPLDAIKNRADSLGLWIDQYNFNAGKGDYIFSIYAKVHGENRIGGYRFNYSNKGYGDDKLAMSSIQLAKTIEPSQKQSPFQKNGLHVVPQPNLIFHRQDQVFVYFELYNLAVNEGGTLDFSINYALQLLKKSRQNVFSKVFSLFSGAKPQVTNTVPRFAEKRTSVEYLALDMSKVESGTYELEVTATMSLSKEQVSKKIQFTLL